MEPLGGSSVPHASHLVRGSWIATGEERDALADQTTHQAEMDAKLDSWFKTYDADQNGLLDATELSALLSFLRPELGLPDTALVEKMMGKAAGDGTRREALKAVVRRYVAYAQNQKWIDTVFAKFDTDRSGFFEREELFLVLKEFSPEGEVAAEDVDYVWEQCDPDHDGKISRDELLPLAATYKLVAEKRMKRRLEEEEAAEARALERAEERKSKACTLL